MSNKNAQANKSNNTPTLDSLARDLTVIAKDGTLDPVVGRNKEITRVIEVLAVVLKIKYLSVNRV